MLPRICIALVHGVGVPERASMIRSVCNALRSESDAEDFIDISEANADDLERGVLHTTSADGSILVASSYWGDLSLVQPGVLNLGRSIWRVISGLPDLAQRAASGSGQLSAVMCWSNRAIAALIAGPLTALYIASVLVATVLTLAPIESAAPHGEDSAVRVSIGGSYLVTLLGGLYILARARKLLRPRTALRWFGLSVFLVGLLGLLALLVQNSILRRIFENHDYDAAMVGSGGIGDNVTMSTAGLHLCLNWFVQDLVMLCCFFFVIVSVTIVLIKIVRERSYEKCAPLRASCVSTFLLWAIFAICAEPFDFFVYKSIATATGSSGYMLYWYEIALVAWLVGTVIIGGVVYMVRGIEAKRHFEDPEEQPPPSRLLLSLPNEIWIMAFTFGMAVFVWVNSLHIVKGRSSQLDPNVIPVWYVNLIIFAVILVALVFSRPLQRGLHVVSDLVAHFSYPKDGFPIRRQIQERFDRLLEFVKEHSAADADLVVISHSQGTVVAANQLSRASSLRYIQGFKSVTMFTFGSPLSHLYGYYFPDGASGASRQQLDRLARTVHWHNVYRVDDFVGTSIELLPATSQSRCAVGGHNNYWRPDVMERVRFALRLLHGGRVSI